MKGIPQCGGKLETVVRSEFCTGGNKTVKGLNTPDFRPNYPLAGGLKSASRTSICNERIQRTI